MANGSQTPTRRIYGQASKLSRTMHDIQGPKAEFDGPDRLDIDTVHREIFVPDGNQVLVFPLDANGDVAPIRTIRGPDTQISGQSLAVDPVNNLIAVTARDRSILIFDR